jgi:hypothetical protein
MKVIQILDRTRGRPAAFIGDLDWARDNGAQIEHLDLDQTPEAKTRIGQMLTSTDDPQLPLVLVDGALVMQARYPSRDDLAGWANISQTEAVFAKVSCCSGGKCY